MLLSIEIGGKSEIREVMSIVSWPEITNTHTHTHTHTQICVLGKADGGMN